MECSVNHANLEAGKFCPSCGVQVSGGAAPSPVSFEVGAGSYAYEGSSASTQSSPDRLPKLIGLISLGLAAVLMVTGIVANKMGWDNLVNQITNSVNDTSSSSGTDNSGGGLLGDTSWVPSGYTASPDDSTIAYQFDSTDKCQSDNGNGCWLVRVTPQGVCSSVSGSMDLKDSSGTYVNTADASGGSISVGSSELLEFDDPDGSASTSNLTSLTCG